MSNSAIHIKTEHPGIEELLAPYRDVIGDDYAGYRNHVFRTVTYAMHFLDGDSEVEPTVETAMAYHDIGLWTDRELAYLEPSEAVSSVNIPSNGVSIRNKAKRTRGKQCDSPKSKERSRMLNRNLEEIDLENLRQLVTDGAVSYTHLLATTMTLEMGKKIEDARPEIDLCATIFDYYADNGANILAPKEYDTPEGKGTLVNQPVGIVYGIQPWNFPFYQPSRVAAPQIMAGNVVLTKHASNVPQCAEAFDQLLKDAGVPEGVHTNLQLSARNAGSIIDDDRVQGVAFTGSNKGGAAVVAG